MVVITDILKNPLNEGAKVAVFHLLNQLKRQCECFIICVTGDAFAFTDAHFCLNKMLFSPIFYKSIKSRADGKILYIPEASVTPASFLRAKLLQIFTGKKIIIFSLQPRKYSAFTRQIIKRIPPYHVITQSLGTSDRLKKIGIQTDVLPLGVDDGKYKEFDRSVKKRLRAKYSVDQDKTVLLHVGHIRRSRNLEWLLQVKSQVPDAEIIIAGSTYAPDDKDLHDELVKKGILIIREYLPKIEELYNIADYYVFPVIRNDGAIETPLSVLEAMACNLPVITTRFGSLPDVFGEDEHFYFVGSAQEIVEILSAGPIKIPCENRSKIKPFTWEEIAKQLISIVEQPR
jgi:glycosyltransferase involved in cell wall biosynthesis